MRLEVHRFSSERRADFYRLHSEANHAGWCFCAAWWMPTWEGWGERTAEDNQRLREELCKAGEYDGYLLYADGRPAGARPALETAFKSCATNSTSFPRLRPGRSPVS